MESQPKSSDDGDPPLIEEHEVLSRLFQLLPRRYQKGLFSAELEWTCIDTSSKYIAIGTSEGAVFLVDREQVTLERLTCPEMKGFRACCVKIQCSVDNVVAVGADTGVVCIYQLPSRLPGRNSKLQVYVVSSAHHSAVTALEWSQNAMKLFSGDEDGRVICSEIDYSAEKSSSFHICKEPHLIVQLSYAHKILVISTRFRSLICATDNNNTVTQIGKKDRKNLGMFGACFLSGIYQAKDAIIYAARPGLRLWKSNVSGAVDATFILKNLLAESPKHIRLLGAPRRKLDFVDPQLGPIHMFMETFIFTYQGTSCFVIDPGLGNFVCVHPNVGEIVDVSVGCDEVFILCRSGIKPIIRLGAAPDASLGKLNSETGEDRKQFVLTSSKLSSSIVGTLKGVGEKLQAVQEGHKDVHTPPWGMVGKEEEEINVEDGVSTTQFSSVNDKPVIEAENVSTASEADAQTPPQEIPGAKVVPAVVTAEISKEEEVIVDKAVKSEEGHTESVPPAADDDAGGFHQQIDKLLPVEEEDIVFSSTVSKAKKTKRKKIKAGIAIEQDTTSISSYELESTDKKHSSAKSSPAHGNSPVTVNQGGSVRSTGQQQNEEPVSNGNADGACRQPHQLATIEKTDAETTSSHKQANEFGIDFNALLNKDCIDNSRHDEAHQTHLGDNHPEPDRTDTAEHTENTCSDTLTSKDTDDVPTQSDSNQDTHTILQNIIKDNIPLPNFALNAQCSSPSKPFPVETVPVGEVSSSEACHKLTVDLGSPVSFPSGAKQEESHEVPESPDNFVSIYAGRSWSLSSVESEPSIAELLSPSQPNVKQKSSSRQKSLPSSDAKTDGKVQEGELSSHMLRMADSWTEFLTPSSVSGFCVSDKHIWVTDKSEHLYYSGLSGPGLRWKKTDLLAKQIAVSPSGWIIWRLHANSVYIGTTITTRVPYGLKPVEIARDVASIAVDNDSAWYIKTNGDIMMQKGLTRDRPSFRSIPVSCCQPLEQISCHNGVIWALGKDGSVLVRTGVRRGFEQGENWQCVKSLEADVLPCSISVGDDNTVWLLDVGGGLWFTTEVTRDHPQGNGKWWQVSLSEYLMSDASAMENLRAAVASNIPQNIAKLTGATYRAGLLSATNNGMWLCPGSRNSLHVCRGSLLGHQWKCIKPDGLPSLTQWHCVSAQAAAVSSGHIWTQLSSGSLFCIPVNGSQGQLREITCPVETLKPFAVLSATQHAVWGVDNAGKVYIRSGVTPHCPQGIKWTQLDLTQLGSTHIVSLSCGFQNVWAVDKFGKVYLRIGLVAPSQTHLNPAWVPVDGSTNAIGTKFCYVAVGPNDWMVWAIDSRKNVYVRRNVTDSMPIGTHWVHVEGASAESLAISKDLVYALTPEKEIVVRHGICPNDVMGDYWKKIPGSLHMISVTYDNVLYGINNESQLLQRFVHFMQRKRTLEDLGQGQEQDLHPDGWEIL